MPCELHLVHRFHDHLSQFLRNCLLRYNYANRIALVPFMPISLRLPIEIESQIAGFGARLGLTKSAVIVRSIEEFLAHHAQPSSLEIYEAAMQASAANSLQGDAVAVRNANEARPHKLKVRAVIARKHAERSRQALAASHAEQSRSTTKPKSTRSVSKSV